MCAVVVVAVPVKASDTQYDFEIKRGLEIVGTDERPRVIFFLPALTMPLHETKIDRSHIFNDAIIEKDIEQMKKEDGQ